jgi:Kdo2-lipid IVA lauroyltransferase/acyltransferase
MYYLLLIILYPLSLLPMRVLYILSDAVFVIIYHIIGYRRWLVMENLYHAFPEKPEAELQQISKQFYHSFCDQWIETLKLLTMSPTQLNKRIKANWDVFTELHKEGRNTYNLLGHTFNWEWFNIACQINAPQQFFAVYLPQSNKAFDRLMQRVRQRSGGLLISMMSKKSGFQQLKNTQFIVGLVSDQNPPNLKSAAWLPFMHREAPFFKGPERLATKDKAAVVFTGIRKIKRGYYEVFLQKITDDASTMQPGEIMQEYVRFMEQQLHHQPENWMWTHRRWKYHKEQVLN